MAESLDHGGVYLNDYTTFLGNLLNANMTDSLIVRRKNTRRKQL